MAKRKMQFDEIGYWSEVKLEIVKKYAKAYSTILANQEGLTHYYIDGFAGAGRHISKTTGEWVPGSPLNALNVAPPFVRYFLIDIVGDCVESLREIVGERADITLRQMKKRPNEAVVEAFRERLRTVARFKNVPMPMPMRNSSNAVVYYLFFASQNDTANAIVEDIFSRYGDRGAS